MDYSSVGFWMDVFNKLLTMGIVGTLFVMRGQIATTKSIDDLDDKLTTELSNQKVSIARLEQDIKNSPTHESIKLEVKGIYDRINGLSDGFHVLSGEFKAVSKSIDNLVEWERKRSNP